MYKFPIIFAAVLATLFTLMGLSAITSRLFVLRSIRRLLKSIGREELPNFSAELVNGLPDPVQRYLHYALKEGQPNIRYAKLKQEARFKNRPESNWFTVKATEYISGMEPGFVWDARLRHNAFWWRTAKLALLEDKGFGHIKMFGAFTIQEFEGPQTNRSMLFRFLSELVWLPTGLLPTKQLRWEHIDATKSKAILVDGETSVDAIFHFNEIGEVTRIVTKSKYRDHKSGFERAQFTLECKSYSEVDGVMIPTEVDFVWNLETGDFVYGQFRITDVEYFYAK
ncbi:MAG: hypothetical protein HQ472_09680 [Ignavibacteria bacterium]|nr:hypothetical protein [Ignavibacteria bacterium]